MLSRALFPFIQADLARKLILLCGPRQSGKTTLARSLSKDVDYLNFDSEAHRRIIRDQSWDRGKELVVFDEIHKMRHWKRWLKGVVDVEGLCPKLVVTGSARLDTARKMGDSLAGRHFQYRLLPLDLKEVAGQVPRDEAWKRLKAVGGFPEPFTDGTAGFYEKWKRSHLDVILRQDLIELESVSDIRSIEVLIGMLTERVGSTVSYASLARDLSRDPKTVKRWIDILEDLYVVFRVTPYSRGIQRSIRKEPKIYLFDVGRLSDRPAAQLENLVALSLYKESCRLLDCEGKPSQLHFLRNKERKEIDFIFLRPGATALIEVKEGDDALSPNFKAFAGQFKGKVRCLQLVEKLGRMHTFPAGERIAPASQWLEGMDFGT